MNEQELTREISNHYFRYITEFFMNAHKQNVPEHSLDIVVKNVQQLRFKAFSESKAFLKRFQEKIVVLNNTDYYGRLTYFILTLHKEFKAQVEAYYEQIVYRAKHDRTEII
jgi:hypothetical protein